MTERKIGLGLVAAVGAAAFAAGVAVTYLASRLAGDTKPPAIETAAPADVTGAEQAAGTTTDSDAERAPDDVVIATVNGHDIYRSDLMDAFTQLPPQAQQLGMEFVYLPLLERLIDTSLLKTEAEERLSPDDPEVVESVSKVRDQIIVQVYFQRQLDERLTDEKLKEKYDLYLAENPPAEEVQARHILLETEEKALEVLALVKGGMDFAEAAKAYSTGPSGPSGGDLGFFTKDRMVAPFADAAFGLKAGEVSPAPVQTEFGWHIIKAEARRLQPAPSFDEMQEQLSEELSREIAGDLISGLREGAEIVTFDIDGNPLPEEGAAPDGAESEPADSNTEQQQ